MIRQILTVLVPLVAPTILYMLWIKIRTRKEEALAEGQEVPEWQKLPWPWLVGIGAVLTVASLLFTGLQADLEDKGKYVPPHMENGELVPGHFDKPQ
ncbi:DUF6111 family protein [Aestuariispira ectoiniformans]|uniref:DUF6111 family protein n=1 Tax=Aestuariispira ectoiniformans TaxID=2775080 RepID=UPI00223B04B2|nr:DUF6111 family protein [Aestuariispira ectoiniformans]